MRSNTRVAALAVAVLAAGGCNKERQAPTHEAKPAAGAAAKAKVVVTKDGVKAPGVAITKDGVKTVTVKDEGLVDVAALRRAAAITGKVLTCASGDCKQSCPKGRCTTTCAGGNCKQSCGAGATCSFGCAGGDCIQRCAAGATCTLGCTGGDCKRSCAAKAKCTKTCTGGDCSG